MTEAIIELSIKAYTMLLPLAWIGIFVTVLILLPMSLFKRTRESAGKGMYYVSWLLAATTWFLGCAVTFASWGWIALIIGLLLGGVGVVPIAILAAFISLEIYSLGFSLITMVILVFATRVGGIALMVNANK